MSSATETEAHETEHAESGGHRVAHHFYSFEQQKESSTLGMWLFLAQEIMFFGGLFTCYMVYRFLYPETFVHASHTLSVPIGTFNTGVLLASSFTMALGVYYSQIGAKKMLIYMLLATLALGLVFVGVKLQWEWKPKYEHGMIPGSVYEPHMYEGMPEREVPAYQHLIDHPRESHMFFFLYFAMTGMHALHMVIGFGLIIWLLALVWFDRIDKYNYLKIEFFGYYWHFVDIVWVFLFPFFYLIR